MPLTSGVNHVAVVTTDVDRLIGFYGQVFDADVTMDLDEGDMRHAAIHVGGGACLHAFEMPDNPHAAGSTAMFGRGHLDHIAFDIPDAATFDEVRRRLVDAGASDGLCTDFGMVRVVTFIDPDGIEVEIAQWLAGEPRTYDEARREPFTV